MHRFSRRNQLRLALSFCFLFTGAERSWGTNPVIDTCLVSLIHDVEIPVQEAGLLRSIPIQEGQQLAQGELVAQLNDADARTALAGAEAELRAAQTRTEDDVEVRYAIAAHELAQQEYLQAVDLYEQGAKTLSEVRRLELTRSRAALEIDRQRLTHNIAGISVEVREAELAAVEASVARRKAVAPFAGEVMAVYRQPGEWVQTGEPVARIALLNQMRVEGRVDGNQFDPAVVANRPVEVQAQLAGGRTVTLRGNIVYVSQEVQSGNYYRVRAEVENQQYQGQWVLRPGIPARMEILTD